MTRRKRKETVQVLPEKKREREREGINEREERRKEHHPLTHQKAHQGLPSLSLSLSQTFKKKKI
jgi:hypothetical protein